MSSRKTIAFKGTESQKARVDDVAQELGMTRSDFMETVVMSYVEWHEQNMSREDQIVHIRRSFDTLIGAVRRLDVFDSLEEKYGT